MLIKGVFRVSNKIISAPNEIINTIKYEKNLLLWVFLTNSGLLSVSLIADNSDFVFLFSSTGRFISWSLDLLSSKLSISSYSNSSKTKSSAISSSSEGIGINGLSGGGVILVGEDVEAVSYTHLTLPTNREV